MKTSHFPTAKFVHIMFNTRKVEKSKLQMSSTIHKIDSTHYTSLFKIFSKKFLMLFF